MGSLMHDTSLLMHDTSSLMHDSCTHFLQFWLMELPILLCNYL